MIDWLFALSRTNPTWLMFFTPLLVYLAVRAALLGVHVERRSLRWWPCSVVWGVAVFTRFYIYTTRSEAAVFVILLGVTCGSVGAAEMAVTHAIIKRHTVIV